MQPKRTKHIVWIVIGSLLLLASPIIARWQYEAGMQRAFETVNRGYQGGIADPPRLSGNIDSVLYACAGGLFGSIVGLIILIVSIVFFVRASRTSKTSDAVSVESGNA